MNTTKGSVKSGSEKRQLERMLWLRISRADHDRVRAAAEAEGQTVSAWIRDIAMGRIATQE
jgi:predicted HicB family RNase H-like nuclease